MHYSQPGLGGHDSVAITGADKADSGIYFRHTALQFAFSGRCCPAIPFEVQFRSMNSIGWNRLVKSNRDCGPETVLWEVFVPDSKIICRRRDY